MMPAKITRAHLERAAYVYVRQSTPTQVLENLESRRRQYGLADRARALGFRRVEVVDEDLGRSGSGRVARPGFERLVSAVCLEQVGGVFALEASRLARNNRDWSHLVDLCGLTETLIIDAEGIYDPRESNDRLLLGLKGTMSEWELGMLRQRSLAAIRQKAERGEFYTTVPIGYIRTGDNRCEQDPDQRIQQMIGLVFRKFEEMGSIRQVLLWFRSEGVELPAVEYGPFGRAVIWKLPVYNTIRSVLTNPIYGGAYAYGRTKTRITVEGGRAVQHPGQRLPQSEWRVLIPDHHEGYVNWDRFQTTQRQIAENTQRKGLVGRGTPRHGPALVAGLLRCRRCGRRLHVAYSGKDGRVPRYACRGASVNHGTGSCLSFGGLAVDRAVEAAVLAILEPGAVEAALEAQHHVEAQWAERRELFELKLQQAQYEAERARRQYDVVDPENRLVASELEHRWNDALATVGELERRRVGWLEEKARHTQAAVDREALTRLADELPRVWNHPSADLRLKKRIVRTLIEEILVEVDDERAQIDLVIRWAGGQHSRLQVRKRRTGEHRYRTDRTVVDLVRELAPLLPDGQIARVLNRLGLRTGRGNTWIASRVVWLRNHNGIPVHDRNALERAGIVTMEQAATILGVSPTTVRRLIRLQILPGRQVVPYAPWIIEADDLEHRDVRDYVDRVKRGQTRPRTVDVNQLTVDNIST